MSYDMESKQFSDAKEQKRPYDFHNALKKAVESKPERMPVSITPRDND
jgi:hypothetical protein